MQLKVLVLVDPVVVEQKIRGAIALDWCPDDLGFNSKSKLRKWMNQPEFLAIVQVPSGCLTVWSLCIIKTHSNKTKLKYRGQKDPT